MCSTFTISPAATCEGENLQALISFFLQLQEGANVNILNPLGVHLWITPSFHIFSNNICQVTYCWDIPAGFSSFFVLASPLFLKCGQLFLFWLCLHLFYKLIPEIRG